MKNINIILSLFVLAFILAGCAEKLNSYNDSQTKLGFYYEQKQLSSFDYVIEDSLKSVSFIYEDADLDIVEVQVAVQTIGFVSDKDRAFTVEQIPAGEGLTDAVAGVDYVALTDSSVSDKLVIKAGEAIGYVPLLFYRTDKIETERIYVRLRIIANDNFALGLPQNIERTVEVSEMLTLPTQWYTSKSDEAWAGEYGPEKYRFMLQAAPFTIDDDWWVENFNRTYISDEGYASFLGNFFTQELCKYNAQRVANGEEVLSEEPSVDGGNPIPVQFIVNGELAPYL